MATRYRSSSRGGTSRVLNELCELTGWHRGHARQALRAAPGGGASEGSGSGVRRECEEALGKVWAVMDAPADERMAPFVPSRRSATPTAPAAGPTNDTSGTVMPGRPNRGVECRGDAHGWGVLLARLVLADLRKREPQPVRVSQFSVRVANPRHHQHCHCHPTSTSPTLSRASQIWPPGLFCVVCAPQAGVGSSRAGLHRSRSHW